MKVLDFISTLNDLDPDYVLVPEEVVVTGIKIARIERSSSSGYVYPDGIYYDRTSSKFEELVTSEA